MSLEVFGLVNLQIVDDIATIIMASETTLNVLSGPMLESIHAAIHHLNTLTFLRCVVITGSGKVFCAGADLRELKRMSDDKAYEYARYGQRTIDLIESLAVPVVAKINGTALGGGCEVALAATFRVAANTATIGLPELRLGIIPGFGGTQRLSRLVGQQIATRLVLTSERMSGLKAQALGVVDESVDIGDLDNATARLANLLADQPARSVQLARRAIREGLPLPLEDGLELEARLFASAFGSQERIEGLEAFFTKRDPKFRTGGA